MFEKEAVILGNFNVLLLRRRIMANGSAGGRGLPILLVVLMTLPSLLGITALRGQSEILEGESRRDASESPGFLPIGPDYVSTDDPSHGWIWDDGNIKTASLAHRTASYVPIQDWTQRTGESAITGWHALGHDYPIPSDWISDLAEEGVECRAFYAPQGLHCYVPKLTPGTLIELGVIGAFRLSESDKLSTRAARIIQGLNDESAIMQGDDYEVNVVLPSSRHFSDILELSLIHI